MKQLFHNYWQVVAVVFFTTVLALQIPRRALLFSPQRTAEPQAYASFIEISPEVYGELVDKVRMSWQQRRARNGGTGLDSRVGEFTFVDPMPAPEYLPRGGVKAPAHAGRVEAPYSPALLLPSTLALPHEAQLPKMVEKTTAKTPDPDLIELPDFMKDEVLP